jgi:hypothetical protein
LCAEVREIELRSRRIRRNDNPWPLNEPLLRAILESQFAQHRAEINNTVQNAITSAVERLTAVLRAESESVKSSEDERAEFQRMVAVKEHELKLKEMKWASRETELGEIVANRTLELQALRAHSEVEYYRLQLQLKENEKKIAAQNVEIEKLHRLLREGGGGLSSLTGNQSDLATECARLRYELDNSLALRVARSLSWVLGPIRKLLVLGGPSRGV